MENEDKLIAGVDDAGRGPVIGPLIIAGVLMRRGDLSKLSQIGVKDSKALSPKRRRELAEKIKQMAINWDYIVIPPSKIDEAVQFRRRTGKGVLNQLEAYAMAKIILKLRPHIAYVDASDIREERFRGFIEEKLPIEVTIISRHKADRKYLIVSAASILAKVIRDSIIEDLKREYGDFGSGYPSDPKTRKFLEQWIEKHEELPEIVRKSWKTVKKLRTEILSKKLNEFS
ncbi:MAG: ribonuclease HII [archaeon GB-1867-035]|nr:ribonuclease HII [Candidatus Culexmicrobium profundum]